MANSPATNPASSIPLSVDALPSASSDVRMPLYIRSDMRSGVSLSISAPSSKVPQAAPICRENITPAAWLALNPWPTSSIGSQLMSI
ncbi:hypothetical protein SB00610_04331 [Klebsiella quasipneumoniae subsp. similipneumoniae]|nr:hypothetical protein SB00610_04331 [Klebsiella quasipneumoniae subsp. similipneumoniae]